MVSDENINVNTNSSEKPIEKQIRGSALYYSTSQVATVLGETDSKIRYYTNVFDGILNIEISNKQRRYTDTDIEKMKFLIELKNEGMTIKQIQEYCQQVSFEENKIQVKESNPLSIQTMAKALLEEQNMQFKDFKKELLQELNKNAIKMFSMNEEMLQKAREEAAITVDEVVSEKLNEFKAEYEKQRQEEIEIRQREIEQREMLLLKMEENKKRYEEENKGFFKKLFKR